MIGRITSENITVLNENEVFVFGSNLSGRHGKGAAKTALGWGAKWGQSKGLQGRTYGIPTKGANVRRTLTIREIKPFVDEFIEFANGLMEKIIRREPNAYLASLYWDSEMFRRSSTNRRKIEKDLEDIDYKALTFDLLSNIQKNFETEKRRKEADNLLMRINLIVHMMDNNDWKVAHAAGQTARFRLH